MLLLTYSNFVWSSDGSSIRYKLSKYGYLLALIFSWTLTKTNNIEEKLKLNTSHY